MANISWMEVMTWFTANPYRPLVVIVLAQNNGEPLDEMNLASRAGLMNQQMTGETVETAVMIKQVVDLDEGGYIKRADDGFRWELTDLGILVSRQWAPGDVEPRESGPLDQAAVRAWRDRVITFMDHDAKLAKSAELDRSEWLMTQSQRLVEMHVLNRVLGEEKMPEWLEEMRAGSVDASDNEE
jgi:hypothetical protein